MMDILNNAVKIIPVLLFALGIMSGLSLALEKIKDLTSTDLDNKTYEMVKKIVAFTQKIVDFLTANLPHK